MLRQSVELATQCRHPVRWNAWRGGDLEAGVFTEKLKPNVVVMKSTKDRV